MPGKTGVFLAAAIAGLLWASRVFPLTVYAPKVPPAIPLLRAASIDTNISVILYDDVQSQVLPRILKKEGALFVIPSNLAVKLWTKDPAIRLIGITSWGLLSLVSADPAVSSLYDLTARSVSIGDPGSSPDAVSRLLFSLAGVKPRIVYSSSPEITRQFISGRIATAVLPEHAATLAVMARTNARRIAEWKDLWTATHPGSSGIPQTALAGRSDFINKEMKAVRNLVRSYREAVSWCRSRPGKAAEFGIEKLGLNVPSAVLEKSIPHMNLVFTGGRESRKEIRSYYRSLATIDPTLTGGREPDDAFFTD